MKIAIKHRYTGAVLFEHEATEQQASGLAMSAALEAAVEKRAYLGGADLGSAYLGDADLGDADLGSAYLGGAYLRGAYLRGADLGGKKLVGDRPTLIIGPIGSRSDYLQAYVTDSGVMVRAGCFFGSRDEFAARVRGVHGDSVHGREYAAALVLIDAHAAIWTPAAEPVAGAA